MERELETMLGIQAGITTVLQALIATHPKHQQFQLFLARLMDKDVMERTLAGVLNQAQMETARKYVEQLQRIEAVTQEIDPLRMAGISFGNGG